MCMFGITKPRPCETPFIHFGANFDRIYLCALSTDDAVFWFCFDELKEEHSGNKIPRFTKDDEKAIVEKYGDDYVSLQLTLRDVHEDSAVTGTAAIIEHIYDRWHYKRILTIGDSAHSVSFTLCADIYLRRFHSYADSPSKTRSAALAARPVSSLQRHSPMR